MQKVMQHFRSTTLGMVAIFCLVVSVGSTPAQAKENKETAAALWDLPAASQLKKTTVDFTKTNAAKAKKPVFKEVKVTGDFGCALKTDGTVWCWGSNAGGQLGVKTAVVEKSFDPVQVQYNGKPLTGVAAISLNTSDTACALKTDGTVWCWGSGANQADMFNVSIGYPVTQMLESDGTPITHVVKIDAKYNICFIKDDTTLWCMGRNILGNGTRDKDSYPVQVVDENGAPLTNVIDVKTGWFVSCAVAKTNSTTKTVCWGLNKTYNLGDGIDFKGLPGLEATPRVVVNAKDKSTYNTATQVSVGNFHTCAVDAKGGVSCWGSCRLDTDDVHDILNRPVTPTVVCSNGAAPLLQNNKPMANAIQVVSGAEHSCARMKNGAISCWGSSAFGQLGNGVDSTNKSFAPAAVTYHKKPVVGFTAIDAGVNATCGIWQGSVVACWGNNVHGTIGNGCGPVTDCTEPTAITFP